MRVWRAMAMAGVMAASGGASSLAADSSPPSAGACQALARAAFPDPTTTILAAGPQEAGPVGPAGPFGPGPAAPAHCRLLGKMQERKGANGQTYAIRFQVRLPVTWNGRLFYEGGAGTDGVLGAGVGSLMGGQPGNALERGYAVVITDAGHDSAVNNDPQRQGVVTFGWDPEARRNYGGAVIGPVVKAAKAAVKAYYGKAPAFTYFAGGSKGGQEAMMAAQRFPEEFDAVLVGYPGFHLAYAGGVEQMWDAQAFGDAAKAMGLLTAEGLPLAGRALSDDDLLLVSGAVLAACDELDGLKDGMVENYTGCTTARVAPALAAITCTGPKTPDCLLPVQLTAVRKVMDGARAKTGGSLYSDWPWDPGIAARSAQGVSQGWRQWKLGAYAAPTNTGLAVALGGGAASAVFTSPPTPVADTPADLARYAFGVDVEANWAKTRAKWGPFNESAVDFMNADATDLSRFTSRGGKILIYHGAADPVFSLLDTIRWVDAVDRQAGGKADRFLRLYAVPGMNHGGGGPSTDQFAAFDALVAWREQGVAPGPLVATARASSPWPGRTRLLCPYPQQARYVSGDGEKAQSFRCARPSLAQAAPPASTVSTVPVRFRPDSPIR
jgi:feruloyl esterase